MCSFPDFSGMSVMEPAVSWEFIWNTDFPVISEDISCAAALPWRPGLQKPDTIQSIQSLLHVSVQKANSSYFHRPFSYLFSPDVFSTCLAWHHSYTWVSPPQFTDKVKFILSFTTLSYFLQSWVQLWGLISQLMTTHSKNSFTMRTTAYHTWKG